MKRNNEERAVTNRSNTTAGRSRDLKSSADNNNNNNYIVPIPDNNKRTRSLLSRMEERTSSFKSNTNDAITTTTTTARTNDVDALVVETATNNPGNNHLPESPYHQYANYNNNVNNSNIHPRQFYPYPQQQQQQMHIMETYHHQRPAQVLPEDEPSNTVASTNVVVSDHHHHHQQLQHNHYLHNYQQQQQLHSYIAASIRDEYDDNDNGPRDFNDTNNNVAVVSKIIHHNDNNNSQEAQQLPSNHFSITTSHHTDAGIADTTTNRHAENPETTTTTGSNDNNNNTKINQTHPIPTVAGTAVTTTTETATTGSTTDRATSQDYYFDSYAHHAIHEEMLKDEVRTKTYEVAICQNKHLFENKIVLDVGCGTGILSMFAARAGAKHIYAVDCSSIIVQAQNIVNINGLSDKITLIRGKVEEINLPVDTVDIIISEWMGYFLLYESMLDTVLFARDKWLVKTNGIIFPDKAVMYVSAIEDGQVRRDRFDYWDDVYGFDMSPIKEIALREPVVDVVDAKALVTDGVPILSLDILTCTKDDLKFTSQFKLQALRNDYIHGLVAYFECAFTQIHKPIGFSTSPLARYTHWKQTIFYLPETLTVCAGEILMGEISCQPNERNRRDLDIGLTLTFQGRYSEMERKKISYRLR